MTITMCLYGNLLLKMVSEVNILSKNVYHLNIRMKPVCFKWQICNRIKSLTVISENFIIHLFFIIHVIFFRKNDLRKFG